MEQLQTKEMKLLNKRLDQFSVLTQKADSRESGWHQAGEDIHLRTQFDGDYMYQIYVRADENKEQLIHVRAFHFPEKANQKKMRRCNMLAFKQCKASEVANFIKKEQDYIIANTYYD